MITVDIILKIGKHVLKWINAINEAEKKDKEIKKLRARIRKLEKLYLEKS